MRIPIYLLFVLLLIPAVQERPVNHPEISADERKALILLFENTGGKDWVQKYGWLGPIGTECGWYGIVCARELSGQVFGPYTVTDLNLRNNGLKGQIPPEVGAMKNLKRLLLDGNAIKAPLPDAMLRKYDQAQLEIHPLSLIHDVEELLLEVQNPSLQCFGLRAWISADGNVIRERKMCRKKNGRDTREVYYEYQKGKTHHFDRLSRSIVRSDILSDSLSPPRVGPWWVDVAEISVTTKRVGGVNIRRSWNSSSTMSEWELEMQIYGVLEEVEWIGPPTIKSQIETR
jgi:hypothetical protein